MRRTLLLTSAVTLVALLAACNDDGRELRPPGPGQTNSVSTTAAPTTAPLIIDDGFGSTTPTLPTESVFTLTAPWRAGAEMDSRHTCDGLNVAPALSWSQAPVEAVEIALVMEDLNAPAFTHWVIAGIDPEIVAIGEGEVPLGAVEALNGSGDIGYTGPCPLSGTTHTYVLTVHYLGEESGLSDGDPGEEMTNRIQEITIGSAEVSGTFSRP